MSDFEKIKRNLLKTGELFEDPDFPAIQSSVFYHQTPPFQFVWRRPKDITPDPIFLPDSPPSNCFEITPGKYGMLNPLTPIILIVILIIWSNILIDELNDP